MEPSRLAQWHELVEEAKAKQECVCCGFPLAYPAGRRGRTLVKCQRPDCKRMYNALYRRLKRTRG